MMNIPEEDDTAHIYDYIGTSDPVYEEITQTLEGGNQNTGSSCNVADVECVQCAAYGIVGTGTDGIYVNKIVATPGANDTCLSESSTGPGADDIHMNESGAGPGADGIYMNMNANAVEDGGL